MGTYCLLLQIAVIFPTRVTAEALHPAANSWGAGEYNPCAKSVSFIADYGPEGGNHLH